MAVPTAPVAAQSGVPSGGVVVIANGWSSADVGAAAPLAGRLDASVLYASASSLGDATEQALEQLAPSRVILMGGTVALEAQVATAVRRLLPDAEVTRHSGSDRIDTAAKAALSAPSVPAGRPAVIANGWSPSDVGTAAPLAASLGGTVLFANRDTLGGPTVTALNRLGPSRIIIVGGTAALSARIETELAGVVPGVRTQRLARADRVDTAARGAELADVGLGEPVVLANGWSAADVGIAAPLAAALDGSVLFTERNALGVRTARALERLSPSRIILVGGSTRLAETLDAELERLRPGTPRVNIAGPDRISTAALAALFAVEFSAEQLGGMAGLPRSGHRLGTHPVLPFAQLSGGRVVFTDERVMDGLNVLDGDLSATDQQFASVTRRGDISECLHPQTGRLLAEQAELRLRPDGMIPAGK